MDTIPRCPAPRRLARIHPADRRQGHHQKRGGADLGGLDAWLLHVLECGGDEADGSTNEGAAPEAGAPA